MTKGKARDLAKSCIGHALLILSWLFLYFVLGIQWPMAVFGSWWGLASLSLLWLSWPLIFFFASAERREAWFEAVIILLGFWMLIVPTVSTIFGSPG